MMTGRVVFICLIIPVCLPTAKIVQEIAVGVIRHAWVSAKSVRMLAEINGIIECIFQKTAVVPDGKMRVKIRKKLEMAGAVGGTTGKVDYFFNP